MSNDIKWTHYAGFKLTDIPSLLSIIKKIQEDLIEAHPFLAISCCQESYLHFNSLVLLSNSSNKCIQFMKSEKLKQIRGGSIELGGLYSDNLTIYCEIMVDKNFLNGGEKMKKLLRKEKIMV